MKEVSIIKPKRKKEKKKKLVGWRQLRWSHPEG